MKAEKSGSLFRMQALAAAIGLASGAAHAVDPVVTNLNDSGEGSLREALSLAGEDGGVLSTVTFQEGLSGTISLQYSLPIIRDSIIIQGSGITIQGAPAAEVEFIERGPSSENAVIRFSSEGSEQFTLSGVTITRGVGGGVYAYVGEGGSLLLENVVITKNTGNSAVRARGEGTVEVRDSVISGNSYEISGGLRRKAHYGSYGEGAGINVRRVDLTVIDSQIIDNTAGQDGGGIHAYYSNVTVERSVISGNVAGDDGGGINLESPYTSVDLTVTDSAISGNVAGDDGAGIRLSSYSELFDHGQSGRRGRWWY